VTTEFENVPASSLQALAGACRWRRAPTRCASASTGRWKKRFRVRSGVPCAPFARIETPSRPGRRAAAVAAGDPEDLARSGYDGKGQARVESAAELPPPGRA
jgi:5-(carboxyamino)imidazole ribonucleotide synthase